MRHARTVSESTGRGAWTLPGVYEVAPGVHRVPLPLPNDGLRAVNVYVLASADGFVCVDSGWAIAQSRPLLEAALDSLGGSLSDIRRFLVTHVHRDHYTQAIALRRDLGTRVSLGAGELASLEMTMQHDRRPLEEQIAHLFLLGAEPVAHQLSAYLDHGEIHRAEWELPDDWLLAGRLEAGGGRELEVVPTPGHTRGHVVFHDERERLLFAGDHVLPTITPSIGFEPALSPDPLGDFLGSLAVVRARPDAMLLPAHGPVTDSAHARVDELVAHHGKRLDETEHAIVTGASTAYDAARLMKWTRRESTLDELDLFNQALAIAETGAHLEFLVAQGRLSRTTIDGARHYR
jgi:glyoxylase-like metal-dependent hydrolase (beta-lactamase superfamily II)